jgi:hypothetical protein
LAVPERAVTASPSSRSGRRDKGETLPPVTYAGRSDACTTGSGGVLHAPGPVVLRRSERHEGRWSHAARGRGVGAIRFLRCMRCTRRCTTCPTSWCTACTAPLGVWRAFLACDCCVCAMFRTRETMFRFWGFRVCDCPEKTKKRRSDRSESDPHRRFGSALEPLPRHGPVERMHKTLLEMCGSSAQARMRNKCCR